MSSSVALSSPIGGSAPAAQPARPSAAGLRRQVEAALAGRIPAAFTIYDRTPELAPSGVPALDALAGGLPRGALTEIFGVASSGRTSVLLAALAAATARDEFCCLIDAGDSFHPASAAAAGVVLERVLWVRGKEQVSSFTFQVSSAHRRARWAKLEQALRAADLVLNRGGFGLVALDLAALPAEVARRVPLASWFRFRRTVEGTRTTLLLLAEAPLTQSCAALVLQLKPSAFSTQHSAIQKSSCAGVIPTHADLLRGLDVQLEVMRSKTSCRVVSCQFLAIPA